MEATMSFLDQLRELSPEQRSILLQDDPVTASVFESDSDPYGAKARATLCARVFYHASKEAQYLRACAQDLFNKSMNILAYAHLLEADRRDGYRSAIDAAVERCELDRLIEVFAPDGVTEQDHLQAIENCIEYDETKFSCALACADMLPLGQQKTLALKEILNVAIEMGEYYHAFQCLHRLGRDFTPTQARQLASVILNNGSIHDGAVLEFVGKRARLRDRQAYFMDICAGLDRSWTSINELSTKLKIKITWTNLRVIFKNDRMDNRTKIEAVRALLARRYARAHFVRLNEFYRYERRRSLNNSELAQVEYYGQKVGEPLTPDELLAFMRKWQNSTEANCMYYKPQIPWARDLLLARLQNPDAPAPSAPTQTSEHK